MTIDLNASVDNVMESWKKEKKLSSNELIKIYGKLVALKDQKRYIEILQESLTAVLRLNNIEDDKQIDDIIAGVELKDVETQTEISDSKSI